MERFAAFELEGYSGFVTQSSARPKDLGAALRHLVDPASATATVHWGRNYLYRAEMAGAEGPVAVVVKQFRNAGLRRRLERRFRGSKATRSWQMAWAYVDAGIPTAEPLLLIESLEPEGPSFFVTRLLEDRIEARFLLRARNAGRNREEFPEIDFEQFLGALAQLIRRQHESGLFHRDLSIGNVLLPKKGAISQPDQLALIDLNRARRRERVGAWARVRDLCRLTLERRGDRRALLAAYWDQQPRAWHSCLYALAFHLFRFKLGFKKVVRAPFGWLKHWILPRTVHAHIPAAPAQASARDKIVWDHLSDQPHQHAGRLEKLKVRLADLPSNARYFAGALAAAPRIRRRYLELQRNLYGAPRPFTGIGLGLRPFPDDPEGLLAALDDLGVRSILLRLHPWQERHDDELALAAELSRRGYDLAFALPQNRDLVREPLLWRRRLEEIAGLFSPFGRTFQVGQAVNRSKWGIWRYSEYRRLLEEAVAVLRPIEGVEIIGPAVIDFELHATAALVNDRAAPRLDALSSLLYVDRRGAPENRQLGFDSVDKVLLAQAIADTARGCGGRSWITEVNWPLQEGPHAPAGRAVAVDEERQADYLARFYVLALTSGAERVYWWQLVARGYGLITPRQVTPSHLASGENEAPTLLQRRPAFSTLRTLVACLGDAVLVARRATPPGAWLFEFRRSDGTWLAGWSLGEPVRIELSSAPLEVVLRDGERVQNMSSKEIVLGPSMRYFRICTPNLDSHVKN